MKTKPTTPRSFDGAGTDWKEMDERGQYEEPKGLVYYANAYGVNKLNTNVKTNLKMVPLNQKQQFEHSVFYKGYWEFVRIEGDFALYRPINL